jgi:UDP-N-acetylmuramate dehydrogenase
LCGEKNVGQNVPLSQKTTFAIGGRARFFVVARTKEILLRLIGALDYIEFPYRIIGAGSNILAADGDYGGVVIRPGFCEIFENGNFLYADAGAALAAVSVRAADLGLCGLEFACGIPGTVGGAVVGNAGAHGAAVGDVIAMVDVLQDGRIVSLDSSKCRFNYRTSVFQPGPPAGPRIGSSSRQADRQPLVILGAYFFLKIGNKDEIHAKMTEYREKRKGQPTLPSAGCVFRNVYPDASPLARGRRQSSFPYWVQGSPLGAGKIIDDLGFKGFRIGGAMVAGQHANFIVNAGGATARDVKKLIAKIKRQVHETHGLRLKTEIIIWD